MKPLLILVAVLLGVAPQATIPTEPAHARTTAQAEVRTVTFVVENMTCALCPVTVKRAMARVDGVQRVEIDFDTRTATVMFDPRVVTPAQIAAAAANAGYPATLRS